MSTAKNIEDALAQAEFGAHPDMDIAPAWAELAQLRADLQAAQERIVQLEAEMNQFDEHHRRVHDAMQAAQERSAEQARQLAEARNVISAYRGLPTGPKGYTSYPLFDLNNAADEWLAANPAPEAEQTGSSDKWIDSYVSSALRIDRDIATSAEEFQP